MGKISTPDFHQSRISIVTPTRNAAAFLAETIESVLTQDVGDFEYIVQDGGSSDATPEIAGRYGSRLQFFSSPDKSVPEALNKGFSRSTGGILGYLNADDKYLPGALRQVVNAFKQYKNAAVIYWAAALIDASGSVLGHYPTQTHSVAQLQRSCYICQPAAFFRREAFERMQGFDVECRYAFDYDFWLRLAAHYEFQYIPVSIAASRMHAAAITFSSRRAVFEENMKVLRMHAGYVPYDWIYAYQCYLRDGRDQFFQSLRPSAVAHLRALPFGILKNSGHRMEYGAEWLRNTTLGGGLRQLRRYFRIG